MIYSISYIRSARPTTKSELVVDIICYSMLIDEIHFELIFEVINNFGENFGNGSCKKRIFIYRLTIGYKMRCNKCNKLIGRIKQG